MVSKVNVSDFPTIQDAVNSVPTGGDVVTPIYFPPGDYPIDANVVAIGRKVSFICDAPSSARLIATSQSVTVMVDIDGAGSGDGRVGVENLLFRMGNNAATAVRIKNSPRYFIHDIQVSGPGCALDLGEGCTFADLRGVQADMYGARPALIHRGGGGTWNGLVIRKGVSAGFGGPTVLMRGQTTSLEVSNCVFGGKGPVRGYAITQITSTNNDFTVKAPSPHGFVKGNFIRVRATGTAYDGLWLVESATSTTVTVISNVNAGTINLVGVLDTPHSTLWIDNETGAVNETSFSNVLFEGIDDGGSAGGDFAVGLDTTNGNSSLNDLSFNGCFFDSGKVGLYASGKNFGSGDTGLAGLNISSCVVKAAKAGIFLRQVMGAKISDVGISVVTGQGTANDRRGRAAIWIHGHSAVDSRGVRIFGNRAGRATDYRNDAAMQDRSFEYGLRVDGHPQDLNISGNDFFGLVQAVLFEQSQGGNSWPWPDTRMMWSANACTDVGYEGTDTLVKPVPVSATITLRTGSDVIRVGGGAVNTILGGWVGRRLTIVTDQPVSFQTGGNIGRNLTTQPSQVVTAVFDGIWRLS